MPGVQLIIAVTLAKKDPEKTLFTLLKNEYSRKAWIAALNQKKNTSVKRQRTTIKSTLSRALFKRYCATLYS